MRIEGKTKDGNRLFFLVSEPMEIVPEDGTRLPSFIRIAHMAENAPEQYYTAFTAQGVRELIDDLQGKLTVMEKTDA